MEAREIIIGDGPGVHHTPQPPIQIVGKLPAAPVRAECRQIILREESYIVVAQRRFDPRVLFGGRYPGKQDGRTHHADAPVHARLSPSRCLGGLTQSAWDFRLDSPSGIAMRSGFTL